MLLFPAHSLVCAVAVLAQPPLVPQLAEEAQAAGHSNHVEHWDDLGGESGQGGHAR